jgi:hypothetical protein
MRKWTLLVVLAVGGLMAVPDTGEAGILFRRRARPAQCQPVVVCPVYQVAPAPTAIPPAVATVTIKGKAYQLVELPRAADEFREEAPPPSITAALPDPNNTFKGTDRKLPKTTIVADAPVEEFATVADLAATLVPDADMKETSGITRSTPTRVAAEKRTVRVAGFVYAFKKEDDNDYHVILGDAPGAAPTFLNVGVSGLPVGGAPENRDRLTAARAAFKGAFHIGPTGPGSYQKPHEPVPVRVTGSLFWDVDHEPGVVGPQGMRPRTSWEVHPVSEVEFLDP